MAEGGYENPVYEPDDVDPDERGNEDDDEDEDEQTTDETNPLLPDYPDVPRHDSMSTHLPTERGSSTAETSFVGHLPGFPDDNKEAKLRLEKEFPFYDKIKIIYKVNKENDRLEVALTKKRIYYVLTTKKT